MPLPLKTSMRSLATGAAVLIGLAGLPGPAFADKSLVYCTEGNPQGFNAQVSTSGTTVNATTPLFNNLVEFGPAGQIMNSGLAESYRISDDGLVYEFHLRRNVAFHSNELFTPSRPLNADDVLFTIDRQWRADHPYHTVGTANYEYFRGMGLPALLKSVEKLDEYTVRITLTHSEAPFLADLAMPFLSIQSAEYADVLMKAGKQDLFDDKPIGTGPFRMVSYHKDVAIRYKAFDGYWRGRQPLDNLIYSITPNIAVRLNKLRSGECHVMIFPNPAELGAIEKDPNLVIEQQDGRNVAYMAFNTSKPPLNDVRVRRAITMAIDKRTLVDAVYQNGGSPAKNPIPPGMWSYDDGIEDYPFDPAAARRLLAEAGYPEGFSLDLWYTPVTRPYLPNGKRAAEMIRENLERVGIRVALKTDSWSNYRQQVTQGDPDMVIYGWTGDNGDPDNFLYFLLSCGAVRPGGANLARWCNPDFEDRITKAKVTTDVERRTADYKEAQRIFHREAPWFPIANSIIAVAHRKEVKNYTNNIFNQDFSGVDIEPQ
ncbi:ABC transporter substrate-binding protein (plasmid) [Azospirillum oryzae]|uniref:ABC transporter substrate-binding protein n=1 Tax=Azospirillum oryzae TaxID=286727 RepID=A0A6N1AZ49_9PROT|nr:ABC transporter substrate-binding protein [Azospirillum oryzae]KAA0584883.1 ABC transporter substrate-binding protein [Azospirillum oryzae]QKS54364.1 ABC transporter substrate-binding protein [Azospirillum oryzae]GLR78947.1 ABC transporter substrate-binding protein [Azospirillum oryzae]